MPKTDPPKTDIVYPTIYNWNGRLNDHNRFRMQLMLFGSNLTILIVILVKLYRIICVFSQRVRLGNIVLKTATPPLVHKTDPPIFALESMVLKRTPTDNDDLAI